MSEDIDKIIDRAVEKALARPAYLSREDAMQELGVSRATLLKLEKEEGLPVRWLGGNLYRYRRIDLDAWLDQRPAQKDRGAA